MFFSWIKHFQSAFFVWMLCCHFTNLNFSAHCLHKLVTHEHCFLPSFLFLYRNTVQHAHSENARMQKSVRHVRISLCPNVRIQRMYIKTECGTWSFHYERISFPACSLRAYYIYENWHHDLAINISLTVFSFCWFISYFGRSYEVFTRVLFSVTLHIMADVQSHQNISNHWFTYDQIIKSIKQSLGFNFHHLTSLT